MPPWPTWAVPTWCSISARTPSGGDNGTVSEQTLFRGFTEGDRIGPYVSQFFVRPVPVGRLTLSPKHKTAAMRSDYGGKPSSEPNKPGRDYLTVTSVWRARQNGWAPRPAPQNVIDPFFDTDPRLIRAGRDAGEYVHADVVFQEYFNACFILLTPPAERSPYPRDQVYQDLDPSGTALPFAGGLFDPAQTLAPEIPYQFSQVEKGFITLGNHDVKSMIGEVARRALLTVWYYKWNVHRRLRPEEFAGRIDEQLRLGAGPYPFFANPATSVTANVLPRIATLNSTNPQDPQGPARCRRSRRRAICCPSSSPKAARSTRLTARVMRRRPVPASRCSRRSSTTICRWRASSARMRRETSRPTSSPFSPAQTAARSRSTPARTRRR